MTLLMTPVKEVAFEDVVFQVGHLEGVGDALIVVVRHGDGKIFVDAIRAVDVVAEFCIAGCQRHCDAEYEVGCKQI